MKPSEKCESIVPDMNIKRLFGYFLLSFILSSIPLARSTEEPYPYRWVYMSNNLNYDSNVGQFYTLASIAAKHGFNGIVLSSNLDNLDHVDLARLNRLNTIRQICDQFHLEIIPMIFSLKYGGAVLGENPNLAEGIPVKNQPYTISKGVFQLIPNPKAEITNGNFSKSSGDRAEDFSEQSGPGEVSFIDRDIYRDGPVSLRFDNFDKYYPGVVKIAQKVPVDVYRCYQLSCWVRTDKLQLDNSGYLFMNVDTPNDRFLQSQNFPLSSNNSWRRLRIGFNSMGNNTVKITVGLAGPKNGKCWIANLKLEEMGPINILRRNGTPITIRNENTGAVYKEREDYSPIQDFNLNYKFDHEVPVMRLYPGSKIKEGDVVRVSYYQGLCIMNDETPVCLSEPEVYEIWRRKLFFLQQILAPKKIFLSADEVREGDSCLACTNRKLSMGEIFGDCITRQYQLIKSINPQTQVFIWSDMLDPNHNAHADYYLVEGDFTGSWNHIPKDIGIVCWYYDKRKESLHHFSSLGFQTIGSIGADPGDIQIPKDWLGALDETPHSMGVMYTTWENRYGSLIPFGDLIMEHK